MQRLHPVPLTTRPRVSVVIPCYNYGHYLPDAVASALDQSGVDVDVLIVDDCSTDDSALVAERLAADDPRVGVLLHETNRGHIQTYNDGLAKVSGDYVVLLSADDLLTRDSLTRAVALMEAEPSVGLVYGEAVTFADELRTPPAGRLGWQVWDGRSWARWLAAESVNPIHSPEVVLRTEALLEVGGYDPDLPHAGDLEYWLRTALRWDVGRIAGAAQAGYRVHGDNMHLQEYGDLPGQLAQHLRALRPYLDSPDGVARRERVLRRLFAGPLALVERHVSSRRWDGWLDELVAVCDEGWPAWRRSPRWRPLAASLQREGREPALGTKARWWIPEQRARVAHALSRLFDQRAGDSSVAHPETAARTTEPSRARAAHTPSMVEIAMCADTGFTVPLAVALASLDAVSADRPTRVSILQPGFAGETKARITAGLRHLTVDWYDVDERHLAGAHFPPELSTATLYRLLLGEVLPADIEKLVYLDGDTVVLDSLAALYDTDLGDTALAAVRDANSPWCAGEWGPDWQGLGLAPSSPYFNAGVLVIDLAAWRRDRTGERGLELLRRYQPMWADQDALNVIFEGAWTELSRRWNLQSTDVDGHSIGWALFGEDTRAAVAAPAVMHYSGIGKPKPWHHGCTHTARETWLAWLDRTAWSGWRPQAPSESTLDRVARQGVRRLRAVRAARVARRHAGLPA